MRYFSVLRRFVHFKPNNGPIAKERHPIPNDLLSQIIEKSNIQSVKDWKAVRDEVLTTSGSRGQITLTNIDAMTIGVCTSLKKYDLAFSYLDYLKTENVKLNLAILGKIFKLLYLKNENKQISEADEKQILDLYDNLRSSYPVLDSLTSENVIQALSLTKKWEICKQLLNEIKISAVPNGHSYCAVISACFQNDDDDYAWKLFDEMLGNGRFPLATVFRTYLNKSLFKKSQKERVLYIEKMLEFIHSRNFVLDSESADVFLQTSIKTQLSPRGVCKCCKTKLNNFDLSDDEFADLKAQVFNKVIIGKDVFNKSTPEEVETFKQFVAKMDKFDVVIDGLNVAYSTGVKSAYITSNLVAKVVTHFSNLNQKVLVLGRNHMNNWPKKSWSQVTQKATVFLTQNLSQDDPYLLYCALNSGKDTKIISRDLMRGHKFLLRDFHLKIRFDRWLMQRQYPLIRVKDNGEPIFKLPTPYSNIAQKNKTHWHIPYVEGRNNLSPVLWLCAKL